MATLKNDKEKDKSAVTETTNSTETNVNSETGKTEAVIQKPVVTETTNSTETNVNSETGKTEAVTQKPVVTETTNSTETNVNSETGKTEAVTQNQVTAEVKKEDKTYIYIGEELTKDSFILKHKGFYTSEQLSRIETGISNYDEIKENFIDLDEYSENR
ncbi:hypothetical protein FNSP10_11910 [Fusobacterium nucleatum]|nr:hypothetical protein FNCP10_12420 [Fusobacterium nucleatum]BEP07817.1 hypothetical protein FNSP10_11910 [Fusobacterium nucleatum]